MGQLWTSAQHGAYAGALATVAMTGFMKASQWSGLYRDEIPPTKLVSRSLTRLGLRAKTGNQAETGLIAAGHWAFGMAAGSVFGLLHRRSRGQLRALIAGVGFGLLIWAISYMGWIPALGLLRGPWRQRRAQAYMPLLAHVVYGAALGLAAEALEA